MTMVVPCACKVVQEIHDLFARTAVEVAGRFIRDDQDRVVDQCPGDGDALLLSAGEFLRLVMDAVSPSPTISSILCAFSSPSSCDLRIVMVIEQGHRHIPQGGGARQQVVGLKDKSDLPVADTGQLNLVQLADILAIQDVLPRVGWERQPRMCISVLLPEPEGPMMATNSPRFDRDADAVERGHAGITHAIDLGHVNCFDDLVPGHYCVSTMPVVTISPASRPDLTTA